MIYGNKFYNYGVIDSELVIETEIINFNNLLDNDIITEGAGDIVKKIIDKSKSYFC